MAPIALILLTAALIPVRTNNVFLFSLINGYHAPLTDELWLCFTTLGDGLLLGVLLGAFLIVNPRVTVLGIALLVLSSALVHVLKGMLPLPRPVVVLSTVHVVGPLLKSGSFPSGHAAAAMSAGLAIAHFSPSRKAAAVALGMAVLVSLSRVFVAAHFPMDVLGGVICSVLLYVLIGNALWPRIEKFIPDRPRFWSTSFRIALGAEFAAVLFAVTVYAARFAESPPFAVTLGIGILLFLLFGLRQAGAQ
ncbi:MAG TPA: phosphatase PAP2 family protein [Desulfomonilaceae bacterium]|nr:phosphatase PAP2 family protein [Desulfomonilaceae bacterium]